jgi:hypothetical protein
MIDDDFAKCSCRLTFDIVDLVLLPLDKLVLTELVGGFVQSRFHGGTQSAW